MITVIKMPYVSTPRVVSLANVAKDSLEMEYHVSMSTSATVKTPAQDSHNAPTMMVASTAIANQDSLETVNFAKILMNVPLVLITVTKMQAAQTLSGGSAANATVVSMVMVISVWILTNVLPEKTTVMSMPNVPTTKVDFPALADVDSLEMAFHALMWTNV